MSLNINNLLSNKKVAIVGQNYRSYLIYKQLESYGYNITIFGHKGLSKNQARYNNLFFYKKTRR